MLVLYAKNIHYSNFTKNTVISYKHLKIEGLGKIKEQLSFTFSANTDNFNLVTKNNRTQKINFKLKRLIYWQIRSLRGYKNIDARGFSTQLPNDLSRPDTIIVPCQLENQLENVNFQLFLFYPVMGKVTLHLKTQ